MKKSLFMAVEPIIPPPEKMVRSIRTADHTQALYSELVKRSGNRFQALSPIKRGTLYNSTAGAEQSVVNAFGDNLFFLKETVPLAGTVRGMEGDELVIWVWASDHLADNSCNAKVEYFLESVNHPVFTRPTTVRRDYYEANPSAAYGTALTALLYIKVTAGGTGYLGTDTVVITGTGSGATAEIVVDKDGKITNVIVTNEGTGYDSAALPAITVTSSTGSGATLVAIVQPKTATLIHQEKVELPDDDPYANEFVQLLRVYRNPTGPALAGQDYDFKLGVPRPFTLQEQPAGTGGASEVTPVSAVIERAKRTDTSALAAALRSIVISLPSIAPRLDLPDVLESVTVIYEYAKGVGNYKETSSGLVADLYATAQGNAEGSASVSPEIIPVIRSTWGRNLPILDVAFFLPVPFDALDVSGTAIALTQTPHTVTITIASPGVVSWTAHGLNNGDTIALSTTGTLPTGLLAHRTYYVVNKATDTFQLAASDGGTAINTSGSQSGVHSAHVGLGDFSQFDPSPHTIVAIGGRVNLRAETKVRAGITGSDSVQNIGQGFSTEVGSIVRTTHIAPTLHGPLTITIDPNSIPLDSIIVNSKSSVDAILFGTVTAEVNREEAVGLSITPAILPGTSVTAVPDSGKHIYSTNAEIYASSVDEFGVVTRFAMVHAIVLDMSGILAASSGAGTGSIGTPKSTIKSASGATGTITLNGFVNPNGYATTWSVQYGTTIAYGSTDTGATISDNSHSVTISIASPAVFTWNSHGLSNGDAVYFSTTGHLPDGIVAGRTYYVVSAATNTFQIAATSGGAAINTTTSLQSGVHTAHAAGLFKNYTIAKTISVAGSTAFHARLKCVNALGTSFSNDIMVTST